MTWTSVASASAVGTGSPSTTAAVTCENACISRTRDSPLHRAATDSGGSTNNTPRSGWVRPALRSCRGVMPQIVAIAAVKGRDCHGRGMWQVGVPGSGRALVTVSMLSETMRAPLTSWRRLWITPPCAPLTCHRSLSRLRCGCHGLLSRLTWERGCRRAPAVQKAPRAVAWGLSSKGSGRGAGCRGDASRPPPGAGPPGGMGDRAVTSKGPRGRDRRGGWVVRTPSTFSSIITRADNRSRPTWQSLNKSLPSPACPIRNPNHHGKPEYVPNLVDARFVLVASRSKRLPQPSESVGHEGTISPRAPSCGVPRGSARRRARAPRRATHG